MLVSLKCAEVRPPFGTLASSAAPANGGLLTLPSQLAAKGPGSGAAADSAYVLVGGHSPKQWGAAGWRRWPRIGPMTPWRSIGR